MTSNDTPPAAPRTAAGPLQGKRVTYFTTGAEIVVLGKTSIRKTEYPHLYLVGQAVARRGKILITTKTPGAARAVVEGYEAEGGKRVIYFTTGAPIPTINPVVCFTDKQMAERLAARTDLDTSNWIFAHNPSGTEDFARVTRLVLADLGTPLPDGGGA